jgi:curved DNA-binding protein
MANPRTERRNYSGNEGIRLRYSTSPGKTEVVSADVSDIDDHGCCLSLDAPMAVGELVILSGNFSEINRNPLGRNGEVFARVIWCREIGEGSYRAGLVFERDEENNGPGEAGKSEAGDFGQVDHYETLQLSPNADQETIQRVYRIMAQRYHPDNLQTGNDVRFRQVLEAIRVLGDPAKRAAYDAQYQAIKRLRWRVFDQEKASQGAGAEKLKRQAVLSLLYTQRMNIPDKPYVTIMDLEDLLGIPWEHLEFSMWYLKERGLVHRGDNAAFAITVDGVDEAEKPGGGLIKQHHLLEASEEEVKRRSGQR